MVLSWHPCSSEMCFGRFWFLLLSDDRRCRTRLNPGRLQSSWRVTAYTGRGRMPTPALVVVRAPTLTHPAGHPRSDNGTSSLLLLFQGQGHAVDHVEQWRCPGPWVDVRWQMSEVFVARQPIFDRRLKVAGYELLFRDAGEAGIVDDVAATATVTLNALTEIGLQRILGAARRGRCGPASGQASEALSVHRLCSSTWPPGRTSKPSQALVVHSRYGSVARTLRVASDPIPRVGDRLRKDLSAGRDDCPCAPRF